MKKLDKATFSSGPSGPTAAMASVQPTTPLQSSASTRVIPNWQWASLRPTLARPTAEISASQVAEFIYMAIRVPGAE
ncbi:hypothetical protein EXIGLDRAFT_177191 [Exidia glandulosa HHB12029]|uniref:Uncharacterized protein n=1 Tax=Exidia glandulosa HHB12029 TaxID=1314781 RepID=A0A165N3Z9_EXIGL|nr:hypothetical protein EXIGLDRAFT_177191 [Exidia glandulosa HHB12029]